MYIYIYILIFVNMACHIPNGKLNFHFEGAATSQSCFIQSMGSSCNIAEVSQASRVATRWLHMYMFKKKLRHINLSLIRQAEQHGYSAIVVTIDTAIWTPGRSQAKNPLKLSKTVDHAIFNKQQLEVRLQIHLHLI